MKNVQNCPLEGVGGQSWITFGPRSCWMPPKSRGPWHTLHRNGVGKKVGYGDQRVQLKRVLTITHAIFRRVFQRIPISHEIWRAKDRGYLCSASRVLPTCEAWHCGLKLSGSLPTTSIKYCILWLIKEWTILSVLIKWIEIEWPKFEVGLSKHIRIPKFWRRLIYRQDRQLCGFLYMVPQQYCALFSA